MNEKDLITLDHGNTFTTSLLVAEKFGKRHDNVLQIIARLECSEEFRRLNFKVANYLDAQKKPRQMYQIRRDGFAFLAMGFTGKEAAAWKEAFILAFNAMEQLLANVAQAKLNEANTDTAKLQNYWFGRYPHWRDIRELYYLRYTFKDIAQFLGRSASACGRAVKSMEKCGLVNPRYAAWRRLPHLKYEQWLVVNAGRGW